MQINGLLYTIPSKVNTTTIGSVVAIDPRLKGFNLINAFKFSIVMIEMKHISAVAD